MARKKILLVDDSSTVLMMEKMLLAGCGYDIVVARDGRKVCESLLAFYRHGGVRRATMTSKLSGA